MDLARTPEPLTPVVNASTVRQLLEDNADIRLLDVRTPGEFETIHVPGAYNVPLDTLAEHAEELHRNVRQPVVLICRSGDRARKADAALRRSGMENLHVLDGGIVRWETEGHPVRVGPKRWGLERQVRLVAGSLVLASTLAGLLVAPPVAWIAVFVGAGLTFSAVTDTCTMAMLLAKLPYNRPATCDVSAMVRALSTSGGRLDSAVTEAS
jgi:rhodanese-related sulfurtransferase